MKLAIPTYNRANDITTPFLETFNGYDIHLIFHTEEEKINYESKNDISRFTSVVTGIVPASDGTGKAKNVEYFLDNYIEDEEWFIFADDDVYSVEGLVKNSAWEKEQLEEIEKDWFGYYDHKTFDKRIKELIVKADSINAHMIGFQVSRNYYYARNKYRYRGYVMGGLYMWKKDNNFEYDYPFVPMEDMHFSAMQLIEYGCVLLCDYFWGNCGYFNEGGLGTKSERKSNHDFSMKYLTKKYPNLLKPKIKKDNYPDLRFVTMSDKNFQLWLNKYKAFRKEYKFNDKLMQWEKGQ